MYKVWFSKAAHKNARKIKESHLSEKCQKLIEIFSLDPFSTFPPYEKLVGDLQGFYSRQINIHHRLIYEVHEECKIVKVLRMWSRYE